MDEDEWLSAAPLARLTVRQMVKADTYVIPPDALESMPPTWVRWVANQWEGSTQTTRQPYLRGEVREFVRHRLGKDQA